MNMAALFLVVLLYEAKVPIATLCLDEVVSFGFWLSSFFLSRGLQNHMCAALAHTKSCRVTLAEMNLAGIFGLEVNGAPASRCLDQVCVAFLFICLGGARTRVGCHTRLARFVFEVEGNPEET